MKSARALVLGVFIGALVMMLVPAAAVDRPNSPTVEDGVQPTIIPHFGGDDCDDPAVASQATQSLLIPSPATGSFTDAETGAVFNLQVQGGQRTFNFTITTPGWAVFDVVVKGGTNSNHYDYLASAAGIQTSDTALHAPPKGNRYDNLSHVTFCFDAPPFSISGSKFHDRDTDGVLDEENGEVEEGLAGWNIIAFEGGVEVASAVTDAAGNYTLDVSEGTFVVCEVLQEDQPPFSWQQSAPTGTDCTSLSSSLGPLGPAGHNVTLTNGPASGMDFGNYRAVELGCGESVTINEEGFPVSTVSLPAEGCTSPDQAYPFDVGVSPDEGFEQFVVFGGAPVGSSVFTQTIEWLPYLANYLPDGSLPLKPTLVILQPGGDPVVGTNCLAGQPNTEVPDCRVTRVATETASPDPEFDAQVQENETWQFLGDPTRGK